MQVSLVFDDLADFVAAYRGRMSVDGMLVDCRELHPEGSVLGVTVSLSDGLVLVRGTASVLAVRQLLTSSGALYRTLVRFVQLDAESESFVERLVEQAVGDGVRRFSVEEAAARLGGSGSGPHARIGSSSSTTPAATGGARHPAAGARARGARPRRLPPLVLAAAALAALAAAGAWLAPRFATDEQAAATPTPLAVAGEPSPTAAPAAVDDEVPPPVPTAAPTPKLAAPPAVAGEPATRVLAVDWRPDGRGAVVTITADGELSADRVVAAAMAVDGQPRYVVKVKAVVAGPSRFVTAVGQGGLTGIRLWLHEEVAPPELHVVLDLAPGGEVAGVEVAGATVRVTVEPGR